MRPLIFIDNDIRRLADEDADTVKDLLEACDVPEHVINSMQIIADFNRMSKDTQQEVAAQWAKNNNITVVDVKVNPKGK